MNLIYKTIFNKKTNQINIFSENCSNQSRSKNTSKNKTPLENKSVNTERFIKKNALATAITFIFTIACIQNLQAMTADIHLPGNGVTYIINLDNTGDSGYESYDGDGGPSYKFSTLPNTTSSQNKILILDDINVEGGRGKYGHDFDAEENGSKGGDGIVGDNLEITNNGTVQGGKGGDGGYDGYAGNGGNGISITNSKIINYTGAMIFGGNGGDAGNSNNIGPSGNGGNGISGDNLEITNNGTIQGGQGDYGGDAIKGSNLTIHNHNNGNIYFGGSTSDREKNGAAIHTLSGDNKLILKTNSIISGDIILSKVSNTKKTNKLSIINSSIEETTIYGNLIANDATHVSLSGQNIKFFGDATFKANANLSFDSNCLSVNCVGQKLTVDNWIREVTGGHITFNTVFGDDDSPTDKLVILGEASGTTEIKFNKINSTGAQTINGINVIQTGKSSENTFFIANGGFVTAGAYDYGLFRQKQVLIGTEFENVNDDVNTPDTYDNWYLKSHLRDKPTYTPDVGEYLAVETMGNTLFTSRLEDREGASQYQNLGNKNKGNVWVRAFSGHNKFKTMDDQLKTTGHSFVTQIGSGLVTLGEEDQYNLGAMTGFAYYNGKTRSHLTDRESKTKINGYSLGLYGTWYAHPVEKRGAYIDSWVLWNKFKNEINTPDQNQYKYDSSGITASIEAGSNYLLNKNDQKDWWIKPQVQLIYQGVHADNFQDAQGVDINHGKDNLQARIGVKTYLNIPTNSNKLSSYRPYVALNFIHNTNPYFVEINDIRYENEGSQNLGEVKLGIEGNTTKNSQVWLNASYDAGSHSNQAYQGNIGWKYNF